MKSNETMASSIRTTELPPVDDVAGETRCRRMLAFRFRVTPTFLVILPPAWSST